MSDQCRTCTVRGNLNKCLSLKCFQHENWFARTLLDRIGKLERVRNEAKAAEQVLEIIGCIGHLAQGGEQCGNREHVLDVHADLRSALDACEVQND